MVISNDERQRWSKIEAILDQALECPTEKLPDLLSDACAGDLELRAEVEALLAAEAAGDLLESPVHEYAAALIDKAETLPPDLEGGQLGPYRVIRQIGRGGMGVVYDVSANMTEKSPGRTSSMTSGKIMSKTRFLGFLLRLWRRRNRDHPELRITLSGRSLSLLKGVVKNCPGFVGDEQERKIEDRTLRVSKVRARGVILTLTLTLNRSPRFKHSCPRSRSARRTRAALGCCW